MLGFFGTGFTRVFLQPFGKIHSHRDLVTVAKTVFCTIAEISSKLEGFFNVDEERKMRGCDSLMDSAL